MRVRQLGEGEPTHVVVAAIHGDEPAGAEAVESILANPPSVETPVAFVVANERALERRERFVDEDLNRAFPGDPDADSHERRLAAAIWERVAGKRVLDLHTTVSTGLPMVELDGITEEAAAMARATGASQAVDMGPVTEGAMVGHLDAAVAVECGRTGRSSTASQAESIVRTFLANEGVVDESATPSRPTFYRAFDAVEKGEGWEFVAENLEPVFEGQAYAATPEGPVRADRPFYPVLMSTDGYDDVLGFRAKRISG